MLSVKSVTFDGSWVGRRMIKDKAYYSLAKSDRLLALFGVPVSYLTKPITIKQLNFFPCSMSYNTANTTVIQAETQYNFLKDILSDIEFIGESGVYAIGSCPVDQPSYQLATMITKTYYDYISEHKIYPQIKWIDLGNPDWGFLKSDENCSLLVVHGLSENSENKRYELAKDFLRKSSCSTKIVLVTTSNILNFAITKLELSPDGVFQLDKTTHRTVT